MVLVAALAAAALALPASGSAATPLSVSALSTSQQSIGAAGALSVRVQARRRGRVTLTGFSGSVDSSAGSASAAITAPKVVRFKRRRSRVVSLPLSAAGGTTVAACRSQTLSVQGRLKAQKRKARASKSFAAMSEVSLDRDSAACRTLASAGGAGGGTGGGAGGGGGGGGPTPGDDVPPGGTSPGPVLEAPERCDWLDPSFCMHPFPNDFFAVNDPTTYTGKRINFNILSTPRNLLGIPVAPTEYNRADGFSPGSMIITKVPGLDNDEALEETGAVPITDMGRYDDPDQPIVVINADTGERHPIWAEIDANPTSDEDRTLIIRPARNFDEGARYIVALRNLKDSDGNAIEPSLGFKVYRDRLITPQAAIENRRPHMEELFATLKDSGIKRLPLDLAWDFTVASGDNIARRALHIRDSAFAELGDTNLADMQVQGSSPQFQVDSVTDFTEAQDSRMARRVTGRVTVPCYTFLPGCPTLSQFLIDDATNKPVRIPGNTTSANFICNIPRVTVDGGVQPARPSLYGHGLLGSANEVGGGNIKAMGNEHNMMFCATDWIGFSTGDLPSVLLILQDINNFPKMADRTQQGFLNFMFLGRTMIHPNGFSSHPAFQVGGQSAINTDRLFYDGNSQGGILGGALTALAPDFNRAVLGVPAINYSTLLRRSSDFAPYAEGMFTDALCDAAGLPDEVCGILPDDSPLGLYDNYPNYLQRPMVFALLQMLWDRGEPNGYAHHMTTDPLPNTPEHQVLLHPAYGDHQVANVAAEVEARTIGAYAYRPVVDPGRSPDVEPLFGIPSIPSFPFDGSAIVNWDGGPKSYPGGTDPAPLTNTPPGSAEGADPHSYPRNDVKARAQKSAFLQIGGKVRNPCTAANRPDPPPPIAFENGTPIPCYSHGYPGAP